MAYLGFYVKNNFIKNKQRLQNIAKKEKLEISYGNQIIIATSSEYNSFAEGFLIGNIYKRLSPIQCPKSFLNFTAEDIASTYWGNFILLRDYPNNSLEIIRSLNSTTAVYYTYDKQANLIFSSDIKLLSSFIQQELLLNTEYIVNLLTCGIHISSVTGFENVFELPVGCFLQFDGKELIINAAWQAHKYVQKAYNDKKELQKQLYNVLYETTKCSIMPYDVVILDYSGGVDSTALLYILEDLCRKNNKKLLAINQYHPDINSSNELELTSKVCADLNVKLVHLDYNNCLPFNKLDKLPKFLNKPFIDLGYYDSIIFYAENIKKLDNYCIISGAGGDQLFSSPPIPESLVDILLNKKFKIFYEKVKQIAVHYRLPMYLLFKLISSKMLDYFLDKDHISIIESNKKELVWLLQNLSDNKVYKEQLHPFYSSQKNNLLPGKFYHIDAIFNAFAEIAFSLKNEIFKKKIFFPILSQPLVELVLTIPTYEFYDSEYDRVLLRKALQSQHPLIKINQQKTGNLSGVLQCGLKKNYADLYKMCMNSFLHGNKILNKQAFEKYINTLNISGTEEDYDDFLRLLSVKIFIKGWK